MGPVRGQRECSFATGPKMRRTLHTVPALASGIATRITTCSDTRTATMWRRHEDRSPRGDGQGRDTPSTTRRVSSEPAVSRHRHRVCSVVFRSAQPGSGRRQSGVPVAHPCSCATVEQLVHCAAGRAWRG